MEIFFKPHIAVDVISPDELALIESMLPDLIRAMIENETITDE
jgi:hypothetical protein